MKREDELHTPMSAVCWHAGLGSSLSFKYWALGLLLREAKNPSFLELSPFSPISFLKHHLTHWALFWLILVSLNSFAPKFPQLDTISMVWDGVATQIFPLKLCSVETAEQTSVRALQSCPGPNASRTQTFSGLPKMTHERRGSDGPPVDERGQLCPMPWEAPVTGWITANYSVLCKTSTTTYFYSSVKPLTN